VRSVWPKCSFFLPLFSNKEVLRNCVVVSDHDVNERSDDVKGMEQRSNDAASKGAPIEHGKEECASSMGQRRNNAVVKDAQIELSKEEFASSMGQRRSDAVVMVAQAKL
jgi:hypothetical protein